jgi:hypothetical protein
MSVSHSTGQMTVVLKRAGHQGVLAGLLGCAFGILGIFTLGIIFVPLGILCSVVGLLRAIFVLSGPGIGCSVLGIILSAWGVVTSPSLWMILIGAGILTAHLPAQDHAAPSRVPEVPRIPDHVEQHPAPLLGTPRTDATDEYRRTLADLNAVMVRMGRFNGNAKRLLAKLPETEQRYHAITDQMRAYSNRKWQLAGNPNAGVARGNSRSP